MAEVMTTPHFAWPFRLAEGGGSFEVVEQDSIDEIEQSVIVLVSTELGSREELPGYGITDPTFTTVVDEDEIQQAIDDWEDRATVDIQQNISNVSELIRNVRINTSVS